MSDIEGYQKKRAQQMLAVEQRKWLECAARC
jgi:hypothetical protein